MDEKQFVFISGLHRSGTSILFKCLKEHADISGFSNTGVSEDEGQLLQSVYPAAWKYGGPGKFGFKSAMNLTKASSLVTDENRQRLLEEWGEYWDISRKVLIEKSPPNLTKTCFLQALFPESLFITIIRHPIAVSLATKKWSKTSLRSLLSHWFICHDIFLADHQHLKRSLVMKYSDFVADPDRALAVVYQVLGLDVIPTGLEIRRDVNTRYFGWWNDLRQSLLFSRYIKQLEDKYDQLASRYGFSMKSLGTATDTDIYSI